MGENYDYVVIGAGSGGCAVARRLADAGASVLLVEAGGSNRSVNVKAPLAFSKQFHTAMDWDYWTEPEPHLFQRRLFSPRGKMLGGCSSMNAMIYIRGNRLDYDGWAEAGAAGWGWDEVLPVFKRSEDNSELAEPLHGRGGPLKITKQTYLDPASSELIEAGVAVGIPRNPDFNGERQDGIGAFQVTHHHGMRYSSAEAYLKGAPKNLTIQTKTLATRIVLENGRAAAVQLTDANGKHGRRVEVGAELILAGGAFNTPALLQHSGIGPADFLSSVGVQPLVDLPAVGEHLMEHPLVYTTYELKRGVGLFDAEDPDQLAKWLLLRRGKLTSNFAEVGAFLRTDPSLPAPDIELHCGAAYFFEHNAMGWDAPAMTIAPSLIGSSSRGTVRIRSADATRKPAVTYNMLSEQGEVDALVQAVLRSREIASVAQERGLLGGEVTPGPRAQTPEQIENWIRATIQHTYHPACTARIGSPSDGVVDPQLRVHGVEGLRIADASVMPTVTRGNTHAPTVMIGERCADFIRSAAGSASSRAKVEEVA